MVSAVLSGVAMVVAIVVLVGVAVFAGLVTAGRHAADKERARRRAEAAKQRHEASMRSLRSMRRNAEQDEQTAIAKQQHAAGEGGEERQAAEEGQRRTGDIDPDVDRSEHGPSA